MPVKNYVNVNGRIRGEAVGRHSQAYVSDALGSVVAVVDATNAKTYSARFKPYGEDLVSNGAEPSFTWSGTWGYLKKAGTSQSRYSVRARFYDSIRGRWNASDTLWPHESGYMYVYGRPTVRIDYTGEEPFIDDKKCPDMPKDIKDSIEAILKTLCDSLDKKGQEILDCMKNLPTNPKLPVPGVPGPDPNLDPIKCLKERCKLKGLITCQDTKGVDCTKDYDFKCTKPALCGQQTTTTIKVPACAQTFTAPHLHPPEKRPSRPVTMCSYFFDGSLEKDCPGAKSGCGTGTDGKPDPTFNTTIMHETLHACANHRGDGILFNDAAKCIIKAISK